MQFNNELVIKAQNGDTGAFEVLINEFRDMAVGYAYSILKDYQYAEDVAQESFVQAFFKLKMLQSPEAFSSWFRKIVFSQCEHFYRKKRLPVVPLDAALEAHSQEESPVEIVEHDELKNEIFKAISTLPKKERTVTILFYISEKSMADISEFLGLSVSAIKNRLYSARKKLHKKMIDVIDDTFMVQRIDSCKPKQYRPQLIIVGG